MSPSLIIVLSLLSVIVFLFLIYIVIAAIMASYLLHPKRISKEEAYQVDVDKKQIPLDMSYLKRESLSIKADDGAYIEADFSPNGDNKKIMIIAHGYGWNREGSLKYAQFFFKHGFAILLFDERGHGESKEKFTTMGYKEGQDVAHLVRYCHEKYGEDALIGLHGESMGASSVLESLKYNPEIAFLIDDCGYSDLPTLLLHRMKCAHIPFPAFFLPGVNVITRLFYGFSIKDVSPRETIKKNVTPLLIFHGEDDDFVPTIEGKEIYASRPVGSEIHIIPKAIHARSYEVNPQAYEEICMGFINKILEGTENGK